jgi:hypothetical protein
MDSSIISHPEDETVITSPPPTRLVTVKGQAYTVKDQDEMLALAQKHFDLMRKKNKERVRSSRYQRLCPSRDTILNHNQDQMKVRQLLSSLLYLSLMMHKVDDMKKILEHRDVSGYSQWAPLLGSLHSPVLHMKERRFQNERVKKIFKRKNIYKSYYEETKADLMKCQGALHTLSETLAKLTEENTSMHSHLQQNQRIENDLAVSKVESQIHHNQVLKQADVIKELESSCTQLKINVEKLSFDNTALSQSMKIHESNAEIALLDMSKLKDENKSKSTEIHELKCSVIALEKDIELKQEQLKNLDPIQKDLDSKTTLLKEALSIINTETSKNKSLEDEHLSTLKDISSLKVSLEKAKTDNIHLSQSISTLEASLKMEGTRANGQLEELKKELVVKDTCIENKEKEITKLNSKIMSLEKSLSEAIQSQTSTQEQTEKLLARETNTTNNCIEELRTEITGATQSIVSLKEGFMDDFHKAIEQQKAAENKAEILQKNLKTKDKQIDSLKCVNASLETSLSNAMNSQSSIEKQKQNVCEEEETSFISAMKTLTEENLNVNKAISSIKEILVQDVHDALKQQKVTEERVEALQKQLLEAEKEVAVLKVANEFLEKSLSANPVSKHTNELSTKEEAQSMVHIALESAIHKISTSI